jgi:chaperonin GroEL
MLAELDNPYLLITDRKISSMKDLVPALELSLGAGKPLLIIADEIDGEALAALVVNKLRGSLKVVGVKAPGFGDRRKQILEDISILTGATLISEERGFKLDTVSVSDFGRCEKISVDKDSTTIVGGGGSSEEMKMRISQLKAQINDASSDYDREKLQERLAKLSGGVGVIYIGAATEVEMKEIKDRVDDALHATRAAVEEGIVPGGGLSYIRAISSLDNFVLDTPDQNTGVGIIRRALEEPLRQIVLNSGQEPSVVINKVRESSGDFGYNARTEVYENLTSAGVIDPTKVARVALQNATSAASMILTTECALVDIKEPKESYGSPSMPMDY